MVIELLPLFEQRKKLIEYLPEWMRPYYEFKVLFSCLEQGNSEIDKAASKLFCSLFVLFADEDGIREYERIVKIKPTANQTLEERREAILNKLTSYPPFTKVWLNDQMEFMIGESGFAIDIWHWIYDLHITLEQGTKSKVDLVYETLKNAPANLHAWVSVRKNMHNMIRKLTHEQMNAYTHEQLQDSVLKEADMTKERVVGLHKHYRRISHEQLSKLTHDELRGYENDFLPKGARRVHGQLSYFPNDYLQKFTHADLAGL